MSRTLNINSRGDLADLAVERTDDVPEVFWSRVLAEWGTEGPDPAKRIYVPIERLLSQLDWLPPACRRHQVGIIWDDETRALVVGTQRERSSRLALAAGALPLSPAEVEARLSDGRFVRELKPFQMRDLGRLLVMPNGANFSVPGAGKTTVAYALYEAERSAERVDRLLIVAPLSAFDTWITEAKDCFSEPPSVSRYDGDLVPTTTEVCLVNYQRLAASYKELATWVRDAPSHVILDEAHRMKRGWGVGPRELEPRLLGDPARCAERDSGAAELSRSGSAVRLHLARAGAANPTADGVRAVAALGCSRPGCGGDRALFRPYDQVGAAS